MTTLEEVLHQHPLETFPMPESNEIVSLFTSKTRFESRCVINTQVTSGQLGIFFCRFDPAGTLRHLRENCLYMRAADDRHVILCDIEFLTNIEKPLADSRDLTGINADAGALSGLTAEAEEYERHFRRTFRSHLEYFFPRWVIGHEVGHAVLRHGEGPLWFGEQGELRSQREPRERETAADRFVIERMATDEMSRLHFFNAITHTLNNWIKVETGITSVELGRVDYSGRPVAIQDCNPIHPPMTIRLLDLMSAFLERFPQTDTTGFYDRVRARLNVVAKVT